MAGYEVGIASETKAFKQGVDSGIIKPLEDAQKELDELGRSRGPDQLERQMRDAQEATEKLGDETKKTARQIEEGFRDAYRKAKRSSEDFSDEAGENVEGFKDEAKQNFAEFASSFNGDIDDMVDGVQGLTGGLATALTPGIGIPVAVLGAAAATFISEWQRAAEETKQNISDMFDDMAQSGQDYLSETEVQARIASTFNDDAKYAEAEQASKLLGLSIGEIAAAWATTGEARDEYLERARAGLERSKEETQSATSVEVRSYEKALEKIQAQIDAQEEATKRVHEYREGVDTTISSTERATTEVERLTGVVKGIPSNRTVTVEVRPDMRGIDEINRQIDALNNRAVTLRVRGEGMDGRQIL